jgi:hypothetical protein
VALAVGEIGRGDEPPSWDHSPELRTSHKSGRRLGGDDRSIGNGSGAVKLRHCSAVRPVRGERNRECCHRLTRTSRLGTAIDATGRQRSTNSLKRLSTSRATRRRGGCGSAPRTDCDSSWWRGRRVRRRPPAALAVDLMGDSQLLILRERVMMHHRGRDSCAAHASLRRPAYSVQLAAPPRSEPASLTGDSS